MEIQKENLHHLIITNVNFNSDNTKSNVTSLKKFALKDLKFNYSIVNKKIDKFSQILILDLKKKQYINGVKES